MPDSPHGELIHLGGNKYMQTGTSAFDGVYTDTSSVPLRTNLQSIISASANVYDTYSPATDTQTMNAYTLFVDIAISSGACNVYRSSQGAAEIPFSYTLIGTLDTT